MTSVPGAADLERKNQYWINYGAKREYARILKLLEANRVPCDCGDACEQFDAGFDEAIALIKGENKTNSWTSRPLTEEDKEHYGLKGENK